MLSPSAVNLGFKPRLSQTKDCKIDICCLSAKHTVLRGKSKDWLAQNRDDVSEWKDMSTKHWCFSELALEKSN